ncbi:glycoside hydrolase superfamily [Lophiotrema nucula]|uniref:Glycoside hydrolase superfamily n=1 Tax=Lophiotrema nucula TaxID=690887 RepID=A0A6A5ZR49_9PLEO|nr:glycoside hydrolase superfamily [Lophiotrema nucula]
MTLHWSFVVLGCRGAKAAHSHFLSCEAVHLQTNPLISTTVALEVSLSTAWSAALSLLSSIHLGASLVSIPPVTLSLPIAQCCRAAAFASSPSTSGITVANAVGGLTVLVGFLFSVYLEPSPKSENNKASTMKSSFLYVAGALMATVAAHPHNLKRALVTEVVWTTLPVANVIVYVDETGEPYSTDTLEQSTVVPTTVVETVSASSLAFQLVSSAKSVTSSVGSTSSAAPVSSSTPVVSTSTSSIAPSPPSSSVVTSDAVTTSEYVKPSPTPQSSAEPSKSSGAAPAPSSNSLEKGSPKVVPQAASDGLPIGVTYDPYKAGPACKTSSEISDDFNKMFDKYGIVRIYGDDCGQIPVAVERAKARGKQLMGGIYQPDQDITNVVNKLIDAVRQQANGDWSVLPVVSVENERLNEHQMSASAIVDAINKARDALKFAGFNGMVGAVDTAPATTQNPAICNAADVVLVNVHAFFDSNTRAEDSGPFVKGQVDQVRNACGGKRVIVTESGWPHEGDSHNQAVPGRANQQSAIDSLLSSFDHDLFLFNAFDDPWKSDSGATFNAEKYWGIL